MQHPSFQVTQVRAWFDAELLDQRPPGIPVRPESVRLAAGAVQSEYELLVEPLAQRHPLNQLRQLADRVGVAAQPELQVDPAFRRHPAQLLEPGDLPTGELHGGDVLERVAAPHAQGTLDIVQRLDQLAPGTASCAPA